MANLTITLNDELLKRARVRAAEQGTSVNAVIRDHLQAWVGSNRVRVRAVASLIRHSENSSSRRGRRRWTRDELHER